MKLPVYASNELFGSAALLGGVGLSFPSATLGFGRLVRPFHLVLSFQTPAVVRQTRGTFTLSSVRLHHCALCLRFFCLKFRVRLLVRSKTGCFPSPLLPPWPSWSKNSSPESHLPNPSSSPKPSSTTNWAPSATK